MDFTNIQEGRTPIPDKKLDTSLNLTSHLQNPEAGALVTAAKLGLDATLRDMRESGLFCKDEIDEMLAADFKSITVSEGQVILKWIKQGRAPSELHAPVVQELRQFTINYVPEQE